MKTLLIGCGGMGIKTLVRLNGMLSECPATRRKLDHDIAYLAVDTEESSLRFVEQEFRKQMCCTAMPFVRTVNLTQGLSSFEEIVRSSFDKCTERVGSTSLRDHWWHNPDTGAPYCGGHLRDLNEPCGLSAAEAYWLAWRFLADADCTFDAVLEWLGYAKGSHAEVLPELNVFLVAGLAGATGRGTWALLSMKLRQRLRDCSIPATVEGFFFDASCCCGDCAPSENVPRLANSLLGLSELSAWLNIASGQSSYALRLPGLRTPGDRLRFDIDFLDRTTGLGRAPIWRANLVFGKGTGDVSSGVADSCATMSTSLFARIVGAESMAAKTVNRLLSVNGLSALALSVDAEGICRYFENAVLCRDILLSLSADSEGTPRLDFRDLTDDVGKLSWEAWLGDTRRAFCAMEPTLKCSRFSEETAGERLRQILLDERDEMEAVASIERQFADRCGDNRHMESNLIAELLTSSGGFSLKSARAAVQNGLLILKRKRDRIAAERWEAVDGASCQSKEDIANAFLQETYRMVCRRRKFFSRKLPEKAVRDLESSLCVAKRSAIWLRVKPVVLERLDALVSALERIDASLAALIIEFKEIAESLARENELACPGLFTTESSADVIVRDLRKLLDFRTCPCQVLKPMLSRAEIEEYVCEISSLNGVKCQDGLMTGCREFLVGEGAVSAVRGKFLRELRAATAVCVRNFVSTRFSLAKVLEKNAGKLYRWFDANDQIKSLDDLTGAAGAGMFKSGRPVENLRHAVVRAMVRSCAFRMVLAPEADSHQLSFVFQPQDLAGPEDDEMQMDLDRSVPYACADVVSVPSLDRIVVSAELGVSWRSETKGRSPLYDVKSLDYWKHYELGEILRLAEDSSGAAYYLFGMGTAHRIERSRAVGFVSPIFVRNHEMSEGRWRPWNAQAGMRPYDVFVSYRRDGGVDPARMLALKLEGPDYGYKVFFDQNSIRQGVFNQAIFKAIDECKYFVLVVTEGAFDRCAEEDDWVRQEVERALKASKTIIPVAPYPEKTCAFPKGLPPSMAGLADLQIAELNMRQLFEASVRQMVGARFF